MSEQIWQVEQAPRGEPKIKGTCKCGRFRWRAPYWWEWALADWDSQPQIRKEALGLTTGYCYSCGYLLARDGYAYEMMRAFDSNAEDIIQDLRKQNRMLNDALEEAARQRAILSQLLADGGMRTVGEWKKHFIEEAGYETSD